MRNQKKIVYQNLPHLQLQNVTIIPFRHTASSTLDSILFPLFHAMLPRHLLHQFPDAIVAMDETFTP